MSDNAAEHEIQEKLEIMTQMSKLADTIDPSDSVSWECKHEGEQRYMEANHWLIAHGVQPTYDHEQRHYVVEDQQGAGIDNERE